MSDTPKFTVVDRRKFRADEDSASSTETPSVTPDPAAPAEPRPLSGGPRLVEKPASSAPAPASKPEPDPAGPVLVAPEEDESLPLAPSTEESTRQKQEYERAAERLDDLIRAQNPGAPAPEKIGFEHLVQQLYLSALMQMGAGTPEGQRPRIDILGARQTIDLLAVVQEKTQGNLTPDEARALDTVLFELRMTFLELTRMISAQPMPPPPGGAKR